jgi:DNA-binding PadR family transcriptional regulator
MHRHCEPHEGRWAAGRHHRRGRHGGFGGRHGGGMNPDDMRAGRMLAQGDLRLIALALIAEQPRHGYEIIKLLEDKTAGWYSPSPGIVYPTLTFMEEAGYVTAQAEGAKKLYSITPEGRAHLEENRDFVDAVLDRLAAVGEKISRMRRRDEREDERSNAGPPLVRAALENLRDVALRHLEQEPEAEPRVVELLARAAGEL